MSPTVSVGSLWNWWMIRKLELSSWRVLLLWSEIRMKPVSNPPHTEWTLDVDVQSTCMTLFIENMWFIHNHISMDLYLCMYVILNWIEIVVRKYNYMYDVSQPEYTLHKPLNMVESLKSHLWLNCNRQSVQIRMPQQDPINTHTYIDIQCTWSTEEKTSHAFTTDSPLFYL